MESPQRDFCNPDMATRQIDTLSDGLIQLRRKCDTGWAVEARAALTLDGWIVTNRRGLLINLGDIASDEVVDYMWTWRGFDGIEPIGGY